VTWRRAGALRHPAARLDAAGSAVELQRELGKCDCHGGNRSSRFRLRGASAISSDAKVVPDGWDDKVGTITCQVRSFGVDCFSAHGHGFIFSRTGYTFY